MKRNRKRIAITNNIWRSPIALNIIICMLFLCSVQGFCVSKNDDYDLLLEYGYASDYLDGLTDTLIEKMADSVRDSAGIEKEDARKTLLSCGYPEEFIAPLSETVVKKMAYVVKHKEIVDVIYEDEHNIPDTENITIKSVTVKIKDDDSDNIEKELICLYWEWTPKKPLLKEEDFICAKWNKELLNYGVDSFYSESYWRDNTEDAWNVSKVYTALAASGQNYIGMWTDLKAFKNQVGGVMIFELKPKSSADIGMEYDNELVFQYYHEYDNYKMAGLCVLLILCIMLFVLLVRRLNKLRKIITK